jgi:SpoVK/Ycf46/Vps4 family AAA+-type ATPase
MVAHAIASELQRPLLEVSYAEIESKFVGETSKNIVALFRTAKEKNAVLLFDEADALLSKRVTEMHSSSDVSVNQTRSVLLKLLDEYDGICLFTTNFIRNYDPAFMRRITRHIYFGLPDEKQRKRIWEHFLVDTLPHNANAQELAQKLSGVSGADISNAVLSAAIHAAACQSALIQQRDFEKAMEDILLAKRENEQETVEIQEISTECAKAALNGGIHS